MNNLGWRSGRNFETSSSNPDESEIGKEGKKKQEIAG